MTIINRSSGDRKVAITQDDTAGGFLFDKLIAGPGISLNVITEPNGDQTLEVTTELFEADQFGLHQLRCEVVNGCVVNKSVVQLVDQTICAIRKADC